MLRIVTHIERLLLVHDCVIVPKFGGFVLQVAPAIYNVAENTFTPRRKEISFNATLQHSDGLLAESYMQMYQVTYQQAQLMLDEDIENLKQSLQQYKKVSLDSLGSFTMGDEGQMIFHSDASDLLSIESYGLPTFQFSTLSSLHVEKEAVHIHKNKEKKDTLYIPVNRRFLRMTVASAAAIALFFLISTPVKDVNQNAYTASFVPTEVVGGTIPSDSVQPVDSALTTEVATVDVSAENTATPSLAASKEESESAQKRYHVIIASFPSEALANAYLAKVDKSVCKNADVLQCDQKYRVYADKFDNNSQAQSFMSTLRTNAKYKDAWLYISH
jgi:nucleoid DNA-binding protein